MPRRPRPEPGLFLVDFATGQATEVTEEYRRRIHALEQEVALWKSRAHEGWIEVLHEQVDVTTLSDVHPRHINGVPTGWVRHHRVTTKMEWIGYE